MQTSNGNVKPQRQYGVYKRHAHLPPEIREMVYRMYNDEATDAEVYKVLASRTKSAHNRRVLEKIAGDEARHRDTWAIFTDRPPRADSFRVKVFSLLSVLFGLTFTINLMESAEKDAVKTYGEIGRYLPEAMTILDDESRHEAELTGMIEEDGLSYISSIILGLSDALVELTGALAGFTLALNDNTMIGLAGFITGVAATLSMAASEYLARKADNTGKHPLKAACYTGFAYMFTVALLLIPYAVLPNPMAALVFCLLNAGLIILGFTYFVSVVHKKSFLRGFREMICISFGVALISFLIGWGARIWLKLDI
ncbi:MAG: VIT1/CCC1 transporter family protein [Desulfovibrio sp.]|jgi:VIT1/CCC1 family predicted Fe2+/Mn2+ transporter|nr:VIT1/CCC1 transporter family protein [Desulfovibrio sp.]